MPQFITIALTDNVGTVHSFVPRDTNAGVSTFVESTGVPIGDRRLSISSSRTSQGRIKPTIRMVLPVVQDSVVNGVSRPTVVRTAYADITLSFDQTSSSSERAAVIAMLADLMNEDLVKSVVNDLQGIY